MPVVKLPILSLIALLLVAPAQSPPAPDPLHGFLRNQMGFGTGDIAALEAGRAVARQMKNRDAVDVNIFGAVRVDAPPEVLVRQIQQIDVFEKKLGILQVARFHDPPLWSDLDGLTLDAVDVADIRACRPASCDVQLPAQAIDRFRKEVNWRADDAKAAADRLFRTLLFERLQTYRSGGLAALDDYHDGDTPVSASRDFQLLASPGDLPADLPELTYYLRAYPQPMLPGGTDLFYWNKGSFGMKPTIRLNHIVIYPGTPAAAARGIRSVIATSQIYADHYFSATLELRTVMDDPQQPGKRFYLLYTTKSRVSGLTGFMGRLIRPLVRSRARSGMERYLETTKKALESTR